MLKLMGLFVFLNRILSYTDQTETSAIKFDKDIDQDYNKKQRNRKMVIHACAYEYLKMFNYWGLLVLLHRIRSFQDQPETSAIKIDKHIYQNHNK